MNITGSYWIVRWYFPKATIGVCDRDNHDTRFGLEDEAKAFIHLLGEGGCKKYILFKVEYQEDIQSRSLIKDSYGIHPADLQYHRYTHES